MQLYDGDWRKLIIDTGALFFKNIIFIYMIKI